MCLCQDFNIVIRRAIPSITVHRETITRLGADIIHRIQQDDHISEVIFVEVFVQGELIKTAPRDCCGDANSNPYC